MAPSAEGGQTSSANKSLAFSAWFDVDIILRTQVLTVDCAMPFLYTKRAQWWLELYKDNTVDDVSNVGEG